MSTPVRQIKTDLHKDIRTTSVQLDPVEGRVVAFTAYQRVSPLVWRWDLLEQPATYSVGHFDGPVSQNQAILSPEQLIVATASDSGAADSLTLFDL